MKRLTIALLMLLVLALGAAPTLAQRDGDGDGIPNTEDDCPFRAGTRENKGCPAQNLAPNPPPPPTDTDGDGIPDGDDVCPTVAGVRDNRGCPQDNPPNDTPPNNPPPDNPSGTPDSDGDGVPDSEDLCPTAPGLREWNGCPDADGDGLTTQYDNCPDVAGPRETGGCPTDNPQPNDPPANPDSSSVTPVPPPFQPPLLGNDACYVTPNGDFNARVRQQPSESAAVLGSLTSGQVYNALGTVEGEGGTWLMLDNYEGYAGEIGYVADFVVLKSTCPPIPTDGTTTNLPTDFESPDGGSPVLCHLTVGYDAPTWSANPAMESVWYASFWFEVAPGAPLPAGTPAWGVISVADYISLPDSENVFAIAPNAALFEEAMNSPYGGTYNWPTMAGGVQSGDVKLYRLTEDNNDGACGPIVGIDDLVAAGEDPGVVQAMECFTKPGTTLVESCWCESSDSDCVDVLTSICYGGGAYIDAGPDMTACWFEPSIDPSGSPNDLVAPLPDEPIDDLTGNDRNPIAPSLTLAPYVEPARRGIDICTDDLTIWWIDLPNPYGDPFELHDIGLGDCAANIDTLPAGTRQPGSARLIAGRPDSSIDQLTTVGTDSETRKETAAWWRQVLDMTCPMGWIMVTEIDDDGEEVVTDVACDD